MQQQRQLAAGAAVRGAVRGVCGGGIRAHGDVAVRGVRDMRSGQRAAGLQTAERGHMRAMPVRVRCVALRVCCERGVGREESGTGKVRWEEVMGMYCALF